MPIILYRKIRRQPVGRTNKRGKRGIITLPRKHIGKRVKVIIDGIRGIKKNLHYGYR